MTTIVIILESFAKANNYTKIYGGFQISPCMQYRWNISLRFPSNSEDSELLENLEEMFHHFVIKETWLRRPDAECYWVIINDYVSVIIFSRLDHHLYMTHQPFTASRNTSSRFPGKSKASASENQEIANFLCYMHNELSSRFKYKTTFSCWRRVNFTFF